MIGLLTASAIGLGVLYFKTPEDKTSEFKTNFKSKFNKIMINSGTKNKSDKTYKVLKVINKNYGIDAIIAIPYGLDIDKLEKMKETLEVNTGAKQIIINKAEGGKENSAYMRIRYKELDDIELKDRFRFQLDIMFQSANIKNHLGKSFKLLNIKEFDYGYELCLSIPNGIELDLKKITSLFEVELKGYVEVDWNRFKQTLKIKIAIKDIDLNTKYQPKLGLKPYEIYFGMTYFREDIITDFNKICHLLLAGSCGTGKSRMLYLIVTNLVCNCSPSLIDLFLVQISDKKDVAKFKDLKHTRYYADTLSKAYIEFKYLCHIMGERNKVITQMGIDCIEDYNKIATDKWKYIYLISDEITEFMVDATDSEEEASIKSKCLSLLKKLVAQGRSSGIFFITSLQKPSKENFSSVIKNNLSNIIAFRVPNMATSKTILDNDEATDLKEREFILVSGGKKYNSKSLYIDKW